MDDMYALHDMLYQEDRECWYLFAQACRRLVTPLLKIDEAKKGHEMLLKFCRQFQQLYALPEVSDAHYVFLTRHCKRPLIFRVRVH